MHRKRKWILIQEPKGWMIRFSGLETKEILVMPQLQKGGKLNRLESDEFWSMFVVVSDFQFMSTHCVSFLLRISYLL